MGCRASRAIRFDGPETRPHRQFLHEYVRDPIRVRGVCGRRSRKAVLRNTR
jgi:hypothetical protein